MKELSLVLGNFFLFLVATLLLGTVQTSFWFQVFGHFPPPQTWIPVLVYWSFFRRPLEALIMAYLVTFLLSALTIAPVSILLAANLMVITGTLLIKNRFYWEGPTYFMLVSGIGAWTFPIYHWILSRFVEFNPISDFQFFEWMVRGLMTALAALPLYGLFLWFDRITRKEAPSDLEGLIG